MHAWFLCKDRADFATLRSARFAGRVKSGKNPMSNNSGKGFAMSMRLTIEIVTAALLVICISASSAAFAAGKTARTADGLSCAFSVPANATPAARCAAIKRQCGGKFFANYCGDKLLSAM
jgi:hypothetical protein